MAEVVHQALESILDRHLSVAEVMPVINKYGPYLKEVINYSTRLLARCEKSLRGVPGTPASLIHLYYHAIQMADGIEVLAANACFAATAPLQRSLLETKMSIEYMLRDETRFELLSGAWLVSSFLAQRRYYELLRNADRGSGDATEQPSARSFDGTFVLPVIRAESIESIVQSIDELLQKTRFAQITAKFTTGKKRLRNWYQIDGGPTTVKEIAAELNQTWLYNLLYARDSEALHGRDSQKMIAVENYTPIMVPIRPGTVSVGTPVNVYRVAAALLVDSGFLVAGKLRPDEPYAVDIGKILKRHVPEEVNEATRR